MRLRSRLRLTGLVVAALLLGGCGLYQPPLPNEVPNLTLDVIRQLQTDPTLTLDQAREMMRNFLGLDDTDANNRIVDFLLSLNLQ